MTAAGCTIRIQSTTQETNMIETSSERNVDSWTVGAIANSQKTLLVIISALFAAAPLIVKYVFKFHVPHSPAQWIFFGLAPLPGLIGLITYVSSQKGRYEL